jgi:4-amino-4-deoxy-L-arabinose transferase-like glycosyltransferase
MLAYTMQYLLFGAGLLFIAGSLILYPRHPKYAIASLLAGTFILRVFMAQLDPFLNLWDERYHALVAKNMMLEPFKPMLYANPIMPYDFKSWSGNHIWLHKQPLFLWQIALFYKIFGVNEFVLRLPSVIMLTGAVYFIYRIGSIMANSKVGFYGAWLFAVSFYSLELNSGALSMEHNDAAFLFYCMASIWAWAEYQQSSKKGWLLVIGFTSGCAILVKWLTGLLVYSGWGLSILADREARFKLKSYVPLLISLSITVLVFMPWQVYITNRFPVESAYEYAYITRHISEALEGHSGTVWYHLENLPNLYNPVIAWLIPLALILVFRELKTVRYRVAYFTYILFVYLFFSIVVASKLPTYTFVVAPLIFLALGALLASVERLVTFILKPVYLSGIVVIGLVLVTGWFALNFDRTWINHTAYNFYGIENYREKRANNIAIYKSLPAKFSNKPYVVFNCKFTETIELMYYSGLTGYDYQPNRAYLHKLKNKKYKIAVFDDGDLADYLENDAEVFKIREKLY